MPDRVHYHSGRIFPLGKQIVTLVHVLGAGDLIVHPSGGVGVVVKAPIRLNETARLPYLDDLIQRKIAGAEKEWLIDADISFHYGECERLRSKLQDAYNASTFPETPRGNAAVHDLLVRFQCPTR